MSSISTLTLDYIHALLKNWMSSDGKEAEAAVREWYETNENALYDLVYCPPLSIRTIADITLNGTWGSIYFALNDVFEYDGDCDLEELISIVEHELANASKPVSQRTFGDDDKRNIIAHFESETNLNRAEEDDVTVFKKLALELCEQEDPVALRVVGYGAYGGNRAFACDFALAERCMLKLLEITKELNEQSFFANTLGYIYYYGRTNDGVPQYDKAFQYFSFAANCGVYEAKYKLADMYQNGYGTMPSAALARSLIIDLYHENLKHIQAGHFDCKFADIALRMGNLAMPDGTEPIPEFTEAKLHKALEFYYEARYAIRMRALENDYYGDGKVAAAIEHAIEEVKQRLDFKPQKKLVYYDLSELLDSNLRDGRKMKVTAKALKNDKYKLTFTMVAKSRDYATPRIFISLPSIDLCGLYDKMTLHVKTDARVPLGSFVFDELDGNTLFFDGELVCCFPHGCGYELKSNADQDKISYRFAAVSFGAAATYDYLCDDESIQPGDRVIVQTHEGEKQVEVMRIFQKAENELSFPLKRYKAILRKANVDMSEDEKIDAAASLILNKYRKAFEELAK